MGKANKTSRNTETGRITIVNKIAPCRVHRGVRVAGAGRTVSGGTYVWQIVRKKYGKKKKKRIFSIHVRHYAKNNVKKC